MCLVLVPGAATADERVDSSVTSSDAAAAGAAAAIVIKTVSVPSSTSFFSSLPLLTLCVFRFSMADMPCWGQATKKLGETGALFWAHYNPCALQGVIKHQPAY